VSSISEIALFTDDVPAAVAFYRGLLGAEPESQWPGGALFAIGAAKVLVHERSAALAGGPPNEDHFAVSVRDLGAACTALCVEGVTLLIEPRDFPWGRSAYVRDPDGRLVELTEA